MFPPESLQIADLQTGIADAQTARLIVVMGGGAMIFAIFLPAAVVSAGIFERTLPGYQTDLIWPALFGLGLFLTGLLSKPKVGQHFSLLGVVSSLCALVIIGLLAISISQPVDTDPFVEVTRSVGGAVYMSGIGAFLALVGCWLTVGESQAGSEPTSKPE